MKCAELLAMLNEYVDGTVDPAICEEFEKHLAGCNPCQVVVDNIRQTITLYRNGKPYELPVEFHNRLHAALRQRWPKTGPAQSTKQDSPRNTFFARLTSLSCNRWRRNAPR